MRKNSNQSQYNKWWGHFQSINAESPATIFRTNLIIKQISELNVKDILDAGCGAGELIKTITSKIRGKNISGFDVSDEVVEQNKKNIKNVSFFAQDLTRKPSKNTKYDLVICSEVIEHVNDWRKAINTLSLFVKQNGYVIVTTQAGKKYRHHLELGHLKHFTLNEIEMGLEKEGFTVVESFYCGWPVMNLQYTLTSMFYKNLEKSVFKAETQSLFTRVTFSIFNFLYTFSSKNRGPQIFILAKKGEQLS